MAQRYVRYDIYELARLAAKAIGANSCVNIEKYPEGMYNKALLLTMDNGAQTVAKISCPNAGRPHFTTASEVATMDFVGITIALQRKLFNVAQARNVLKSPVPKVYAWSSRAQDNPVGAEYIIMEKLPGVSLDHVWASMGIGDRFKIAKAIAHYQKAWMSVSFHQFGSLYYAQDLEGHTPQSCLYTDQHGVSIEEPRFAVGPSTGREFVDDGRIAIEFDRGPCKIRIQDFSCI